MPGCKKSSTKRSSGRGGVSSRGGKGGRKQLQRQASQLKLVPPQSFIKDIFGKTNKDPEIITWWFFEGIKIFPNTWKKFVKF